MKPLAFSLFAMLLAFPFADECRGQSSSETSENPKPQTLIGQLRLPEGTGSRGVEIQVDVAARKGEPPTIWVLFDEQGRFLHTFPRAVTRVKITAGLCAEVHRIEADKLPQANQAGQIDVGVIDLRDELVRHRMQLHAAKDKPGGDVKVALCFGLPPVGPQGQRVSLGSRQFPAIPLGSEIEWLLPRESEPVYFLIERPADAGRGRDWRTGAQQLFGPFPRSELPVELLMD